MGDGEMKVYFVVIAALIFSAIFYLSFISVFNNFGATNTRFININIAYSALPSESIIFIGDSQAREDIDCSAIGNCFNFGLEGILPSQLALQKDIIIAARPKRVVIGVSPLLFNEGINKNDDIYFFMAHPSSDEFIAKRLDSSEKKLLSMNFVQRSLYKRKFVLPFFFSLFKKQPGRDVTNNFKDPYFFAESQGREELVKKVNDPKIVSHFDFTLSPKRQREYFAYLVGSLNEEGIGIVIIKMPLHPLIREKLIGEKKESAYLYSKFISKVGILFNATVIDIEDKFSEDEFIDITHLNAKGRGRLSEIIMRGDYNII